MRTQKNAPECGQSACNSDETPAQLTPAIERTRGPKPHTSNIELVTNYMDFGRQGPLNQLFLIEAVNRYAQLVADNADLCREQMKDGFFSPEAWIGCAREWLAALKAREEGR